MKIIHITTAYPRRKGDVISPWLVKMLEGLKNRGHGVSVFTSSYRGLGFQVQDGIKVYRFRYAPAKFETLTHDMAVPERLKQGLIYKLLVFPYLKSGSLHAFFFPYRQDIVHVHWPVPHVLFGIQMKYRWKVPMLLYIHGGELRFLARLPSPLRKFFIYLLNKADYITVNSSYTRGLVESYGLKPPVEIIPFGNPFSEKIHPYREKGNKTILFVGRLIEVKGVDTLLRAFKTVQKVFPDAKLRIVGNGPLMDDLKKLAEELGIDVTFTGYKTGKDLEDEYLNASCFVLPSKPDKIGQVETLGVVAIEALSYGLPVVASNLGGIPDIVKDGKTGLLFKPGDHEELAEKIIQVLENRDLARELVLNGQRHIKENFSWDAIVSKLEKLYLRLASVRNRPSDL